MRFLSIKRHTPRICSHLLGMSWEEYARTNMAVKLAVPWLRKHLWLVPDTAYIDQLLGQGIERGCIWTASELADLYDIQGLQEEDRRAIALLKAHFGIEILSVEAQFERADARGDGHDA